MFWIINPGVAIRGAIYQYCKYKSPWNTYLVETQTKPFSLVPEIALLEPLEAHLRKRFEKALNLMHNGLAEELTWEQIADKSAISPYHFHRQFNQLFNQTPGQYLSRIRLQYAVYQIFLNKDEKVIDIAHKCGFSSSQALAKVIKRELGMTAKSLRQHLQTATVEETAVLLDNLAHPLLTSSEDKPSSESKLSLEKKLAESMPVELIWYPKRGIKLVEFSNFDWDLAYDKFGNNATQLLVTAPVKHFDSSWQDIKYIVGNWQTTKEEFNYFIAEGYYLCCEVYVTSDTAYLEAINGLFKQAEKSELQVDTNGSFVEIMRNIDPSMTGGASFSFQLPVCQEPGESF